MKIKRLSVNHFGKLSNLTVSADSKLTLISGENESGKSTLHSFIAAMFFGMERGRGRAAKTDNYTHFTPWEGGSYGGVLEFEQDGRLYSLTRDFSKDGGGIILTNETDCRNVGEEELPRLLRGLTPSIYQNTISVNQLSAGTGDSLSDELRNHIINLRSAGSFNLDVSRALGNLKAQKKKIESGYSKKADFDAEELSLRIAAMEEDIAGMPEPVDLSRLLAERRLKETHIKDAESQSALLIETITGSERSLREHHIGSSDEVDRLDSRISSLSNDIVSFAKKHKVNSGAHAKALYVILLIFAIALFIGAGLMAVMTYLSSGLGIKLILFAGAALSGLILVVLCTANLSSVGNYRGTCEEFADIYEEYIGEAPTKIGDDEISRLILTVRGYQSLFDNIRSSHDKLSENKQLADSIRGELAVLNADIDSAREAGWQFEKKSEALMLLENQLASLKTDLEKNSSIRAEAEAIELAANTISRLSVESFESFGHFLEGTTSQLLSDMTDGAYSGVVISENFDICLLRSGRRVPLYTVSSGTLDQVYLALRLACIEFLWPDEAMPLLLDDTFALYDEGRLSRTLSWLCENYGGQIFIFSCHKREGELLRKLGVKFENILLQ